MISLFARRISTGCSLFRPCLAVPSTSRPPPAVLSTAMGFFQSTNKQSRSLSTISDRMKGSRGSAADYLRGQREKFRERKKRLRQRFADVKDRVLTVPNGLCVLRIFATPVIGYLVIIESFLPACILFAAAGLTDMLDGQIARAFPKQRSMLGSMLDPVADKFLISTLFVTLAYTDIIPVWLSGVVISRDLLLILGGFIRRYQLMDPPVTLRRFFDPSISSVKVEPSFISKVNTALQLSLVTLSLASPVFGFTHHPLLGVLGLATAGTTIYSGLQYATNNAMIPVRKIRRWRKK